MSTRTLQFVLTLNLVLSACVAVSQAGPPTVDISLTTYAMKISPETIQSGDVKFVVKNNAPDLVHEFILVKTDLAIDKLPLNADGRVDEEASQIKEVGVAEDVNPGTSAEFSATLEAGRYVYFCNIDTHYSVGMRGEFTIAP